MIPSIFKIPILLIAFIFLLPTPGDISLERKLADLHEQVAVMQVEMDKMEEARILQSKEYERRLELLNHEADRVKEVQDTYVLKSNADATEKAMRVEFADRQARWETIIQGLNDKIQILTSFKDNYQGQQAVMTVGISFGIMLVGLIANYFFNRKKGT